MIDFVGKRHWYFIVSAIIIIPGIVALIAFGLKPAIDFTGGSVLELTFDKPVATHEVRAVFDAQGLENAVQTTAGSNTVQIRTKPLDSAGKQKVETALRQKVGDFREDRFDSVGPAVGREVATRAIWAVVLASLGILIYLSLAFRKVQHPLRYGICAVAALAHDALLILGIFAILGRISHVEIDALFITALLTVIGFSVHDTIVVFDRIRENLNRRGGEPFGKIVNYSLSQTLARSLNTSLTTLMTLSALYLFGGETTRWFVMAMIIGIASGTYSSIFNASMLLVVWENGELGRLIRFRRPTARPTAKSA